MRKLVFLLAVAVFGLTLVPLANATPPSPEKGTFGCACSTSASTACLNSNVNRHYLFIQNIGANTAYVGVGTSNAVSTTSGNGHALAGGSPGQAWEPEVIFMPGMAGAVPTGDVACKSINGATTLAITAY